MVALARLIIATCTKAMPSEANISLWYRATKIEHLLQKNIIKSKILENFWTNLFSWLSKLRPIYGIPLDSKFACLVVAVEIVAENSHILTHPYSSHWRRRLPGCSSLFGKINRLDGYSAIKIEHILQKNIIKNWNFEKIMNGFFLADCQSCVPYMGHHAPSTI